MAQSFIDLIPWETKPETIEQENFKIDWNDGSFTIPKYGYLQVDELNRIRQVDPTNALYRLTSAAAVELHKALQKNAENDNNSSSLPILKLNQCFALLSSVLARHMGARVLLTKEEDNIHVYYSDMIAPFLEQGKTISEKVPIRSVTVMLQRIRPGWTDDETKKLPPILFNLIYELYKQEEMAGEGNDDPETQLKELEETLGKLRGEMHSIATDLIGAGSSGNAEDYGQEQKNLTESITENCRDSLLSQPLKPATRRNAKRYTKTN